MSRSEFAQKTGKISIPAAQKFSPNRKPLNYELIGKKRLPEHEFGDLQNIYPYKYCYTNLKEGCYKIKITPKSIYPFSYTLKGTIRVDKDNNDLCISGDLYKFKKSLFERDFPKENFNLEFAKPQFEPLNSYNKNEYLGTLFKRKFIPVYPRKNYYCFLLGTSANLAAITPINKPCPFSINFDLYKFTHELGGYEGTFPIAPTKSVRLSLEHTDVKNNYTGTLFDGDTVIGSVTMEWVSKYFRKACLDIHTLDGAEAPQSVDNQDGTGTESFRSIFATAGWDLSVSYKTPDITMPDSLDGIQNSNSCWNRENSHELLESLSNYDASILDKKWKVHLIAIEGQLGCSRGRMFDNEIDPADIGDANNVAREGAVTYSHDGYDHWIFGDNEDDLQKDTPRAFIRSAAHEVGHAFNMIHQRDEAGRDNSIMTTSPNVAAELNNNGLDFPEDIELSFNDLCRHHMIHRPDPWLRPGALEFTGSLAGSPEADDVCFYESDKLKMDITLSNSNIKLGEILKLSWKVTNLTKSEINFPERITDSSFTARISVTYPDGSIKYIRPTEVNADIENPLKPLKSKEARHAETNMFWNKKGFVFTNPGKHEVEINILWKNNGYNCCVSNSEDIWVDYPVTIHENEVASILLNNDVGRFVAIKGRKTIKNAVERIEKVISKYKTHPACAALKDVSGHRYSKVKVNKRKTSKAKVVKKSKKK